MSAHTAVDTVRRLASIRAVKVLPALMPALVLAAGLATVATSHGTAAPSATPAVSRTVTLGPAGLLKAAYTGGATITLSVPTQANAVGFSGATMPLAGVTMVASGNTSSPATTAAGSGAPRSHMSFGITRVSDAYSMPLLRAVIAGRLLTNLTITIKNATASGQTAPEVLTINFSKSNSIATQSLSASSAATEGLSILPQAYTFTYTPANNGTPFTWGFDESTQVLS